MFEVKTEGKELDVFLNGKLVVKHTPDDPFISAGKGAWLTADEYASDKTPGLTALSNAVYEEKWGAIRFSGGDFSVSVRLEDSDGTLKLSPQRSSTGLNRLHLRFPAKRGEAVYGGGAQYGKLNLAGSRIPLWPRDRRVFEPGASSPSCILKNMKSNPSRFPIPVFFTEGLTSFSFDCSSPAVFDFTAPNAYTVSFYELPPCITIGASDTAEALMNLLGQTLGRPPVLPEWATDGVCLKVSGGSSNVAVHLEKLAGADISALLFMDWTGKREGRAGHRPFYDWTWNRGLYPKLDGIISGMSERGIRALAYVAPHLSIEGSQFAEASMTGCLVKKPQGGLYLSDMDGFMAGHLDLTNPEACAWFKRIQTENILNLGFSGIFAGMGSYLPPDAVLSSGENPMKLRCRWPAMWAKLNRDTIQEAGRSGDLLFVADSGWTGSGKHSIIASAGEAHTNWNKSTGLQSSLTGALSLACSGMGLSSFVSGGDIPFMYSKSKELYMRWHELGAFTPVFMSSIGHGWGPALDGETLEHFLRMTRIRNLLTPYIRECIKENSVSGMPVMRPMFMQNPGDTRFSGIHDAFMLGDELLVSPMLSKGRKTKTVLLPEGQWVNLWTGHTQNGGETAVSTPFGKPPAFFKAEGKHAEVFSNFERKIKD